MGGDTGIGGDGDAADQQAVHLGGQLENAILLPQKFPHRGQQQLTVFRQRHALCIPPEYRKAQLLLQRRHQLVHAGRRVAEGFRRFGKASGLCRRQKGSASCCFHGSASFYCQ